MNTSLSRLAAVAAAVVLAVGVAAWLGRPASQPGGTSAPTVGATVNPAPSPTAAAVATGPVPLTGAGPFEPGTYVIGDPFELDVTVRFPTAGWRVWGSAITSKVAPYYKISPDPPGLGVILSQVDNVYANACKTSERLLDPPLGPSVDDLVQALSSQPYTDATAATDVVISGYSGKHFEYSFTMDNPGCPALARWPTQSGDRQAIPTERDELWILDIDGTRLVIDLFSFPATDKALIEEARQIVGTMIIAPSDSTTDHGCRRAYRSAGIPLVPSGLAPGVRSAPARLPFDHIDPREVSSTWLERPANGPAPAPPVDSSASAAQSAGMWSSGHGAPSPRRWSATRSPWRRARAIWIRRSASPRR